jgi:hypothetical protein
MISNHVARACVVLHDAVSLLPFNTIITSRAETEMFYALGAQQRAPTTVLKKELWTRASLKCQSVRRNPDPSRRALCNLACGAQRHLCKSSIHVRSYDGTGEPLSTQHQDRSCALQPGAGG